MAAASGVFLSDTLRVIIFVTRTPRLVVIVSIVSLMLHFILRDKFCSLTAFISLHDSTAEADHSDVVETKT